MVSDVSRHHVYAYESFSRIICYYCVYGATINKHRVGEEKDMNLSMADPKGYRGRGVNGDGVGRGK